MYIDNVILSILYFLLKDFYFLFYLLFNKITILIKGILFILISLHEI